MAPDSPKEIQSGPLSGLHLLLTYECNYECDHCFVWGGPSQSGTMTVETIEHILGEAEALGTIEWIYFEGGEAFLYYQILRRGIRSAKECSRLDRWRSPIFGPVGRNSGLRYPN